MQKRILTLVILLLALFSGILLRGIYENKDTNALALKKLEGVWRVGKTYAFDHENTERWKENLNSERTFFEFRNGLICSQYRATPDFFCTSYSPYHTYGNLLMVLSDNAQERYRYRFLDSQLELTQEKWFNNEWIPAQKNILIKIPVE